MKNATLMCAMPDGKGKGRKVFELKITRGVAMVALSKGDMARIEGENDTLLDEYQHFTIPPDLRFHFTRETQSKKKEYLNFDLTKLIAARREHKMKPTRLLSYHSRSVMYCKEPRSSSSPRYNGAELFLFNSQPYSDDSGMIIEIYAGKWNPDNSKVLAGPIPHVEGKQLLHTYKLTDLIRGSADAYSEDVYISVVMKTTKTNSEKSFFVIPYPLQKQTNLR